MTLLPLHAGLFFSGTYIKEFCHGDFGRTRPSLGELLQCQCDILALDVTVRREQGS
jgi:tRNA U54 and U55 pseudouridine synthase Pus10